MNNTLHGKILAIMTATATLLLTGCATNTAVAIVNDKYKQPEQAGAAQCNIQFFRTSKPDLPYELLAKIESHVQRNLFFGGKARLEDEAYDELRNKACAVGANAVLIDDYVESAAAEASHVHVWASAIRLK